MRILTINSKFRKCRFVREDILKVAFTAINHDYSKNVLDFTHSGYS